MAVPDRLAAQTLRLASSSALLNEGSMIATIIGSTTTHSNRLTPPRHTPAIAKPWPPYSLGRREALTSATMPRIRPSSPSTGMQLVAKPTIPTTIDAIASP